MTISHRLGQYEVRFGKVEEAIASLPERSFVITDSNVNAAWGERFSARWPVCSVTPGESSKSLETYGSCLGWLANHGADRLSTVVALGGGVVGDLAGFLAATYMRGIPFVQIPTSLLAQVDSSVGGKVGIDLPAGKNLVGSFNPPQAVWICLETLGTLPEREFTNGMAEVWKYGFVLDASLIDELEGANLHKNSKELENVVSRCIALKAAVVEKDEMDTTGLRAILNFGHTIGHGIEKLSGYEGVLHGEAIAMGMVAEALIGERISVTQAGTSAKIETFLAGAGLPTRSKLFSEPALLETLKTDKKTEDGRLAFSLVTKIGECKLVRNVPQSEVEAALRAL